MKRSLVVLSVGALVPTLLLAIGWLSASLHAHELATRDQEATLVRTAEMARAAVDESLEELRAREDARPFYLYNHYYSPPDVLALSDPVAVSPLAAEPSDARIVGYFQVEPGGAVRTPYSVAGSEDSPSARERRVRAIANSPEFMAVRGQGALRLEAPEPEEARSDYGGPEGPLTLHLGEWGNQVAEDIQLAQQGSEPAQRRVQVRGRSAPWTNRVDVDEDPRAHAEPTRGSRSGLLPVPRLQGLGGSAYPLPVVQQEEADVEYAPMEWVLPEGQVALRRRVTHQGVSVVQSVVLDREDIVERWLPALVARHVDPAHPPRVVLAAATATCSVRHPLSHVLPLELCFPPAALAELTAGFERDLALQLGMLVGLLCVVALALLAVVRASGRAEELARERTAFVSAVSHELRTPLTTIRMHAEMLGEGMVSEARRPRVHQELVGESVRLTRLIDNVLEVARLEDGQRPLRMQRADLGRHVREVAEGQRAFLESKGVELHVDAPVVETFFDAQAMEQIVVNLLDNAAKYGASGDDARVEVEVSADEGGVRVSVMDRGPGIAASEREKVFARFYRVEREDTAHAPGTGIGLALVRELARAQGGEVRVRARDGGGATLEVRLPETNE